MAQFSRVFPVGKYVFQKPSMSKMLCRFKPIKKKVYYKPHHNITILKSLIEEQ
jgi:hypothetical protein